MVCTPRRCGLNLNILFTLCLRENHLEGFRGQLIARLWISADLMLLSSVNVNGLRGRLMRGSQMFRDNFCCPQVFKEMQKCKTRHRSWEINRGFLAFSASLPPHPALVENCTHFNSFLFTIIEECMQVCRAIRIIKWLRVFYGIFCSAIKIIEVGEAE